MQKHILVTGINSGLGKYLFENIPGCLGFNRETKMEHVKKFNIDTIIHCAYNKARDINNTNLYNYLYDNVLLTYELTKVPHDKFIYISTVDVYPKKGQLCKEDETIEVKDIDNIYGISKLMSEQIVINNCKNHLILRPTALLGPYIKPNALTKIMDDDMEDFTLSSGSRFNYVLHSYILKFIKLATKDNLRGIYNISSKGNLSLFEIAEIVGKDCAHCGTYPYWIGKIDNSKVTKIFPNFNKNTKDIIKQFVKEKK